MKTIKKALSILAVIITVISSFSVMTVAKNVCNNVGGQAEKHGGNSTIFTVKTCDTKKHTVKMSMTKGKLGDELACLTVNNVKIYGYYEIKIFSVKNGRADKQISKYNVKNKSSHTITLSGYREYEIRVYNWKCDTIAKNGNYCRNRITKEINTCNEWIEIPTWTVSKTKGITFCI